MKDRILVLTEISHLEKVKATLEQAAEIHLAPDQPLEAIKDEVSRATAVFTNPNSARFYLGPEFFTLAKKLRVVCTASTGTNHINLDEARKNAIHVISIRDELELLESISSTAEHALALTLAATRNIVQASRSVEQGQWDYFPFIGRQLSNSTIGVVGVGRLGRKYARYVSAIAKRVVFFDPYVVDNPFAQKVGSIEEVFEISDIVSLHIHPDETTSGIVNSQLLRHAKAELLLVNTSRGEIVDEDDVVEFLRSHPKARYATDVIKNETYGRQQSPVLAFSKQSNQALVTPHIGGMTQEAQSAAFLRAARLLVEQLSIRN